MEEKYIGLILNRCIYSKSKRLFISYDKVNKTFIQKLITRAKELGYYDILLDETDISLERQLLFELSEEEIKKHPYFNNSIWNDAAEKGYIFLLASTKFPNYLEDVPASKLVAVQEIRSIVRKVYMEKVAEDSISWSIFGLSNMFWAKQLFPNESDPYQKLENLIYSFCMLDTNKSENALDDYIRIESKKTHYLDSLKIQELHFYSELGTDLTVGLVDNYIFRSLEQEHCIENLPTYSIWSMPHKYKADGIVYGSIPITNGNYLVTDYWFLLKDGKVIDYNASSGKEFLDHFFSIDDSHKRLGEIAFIDSNSPIARTEKVYKCNLFDENISTHLAFGMSYKNTIQDGPSMTEEELEQNGCNICSDHLDFTIGTPLFRIVALTKELGEVELYRDGIFNYDLIDEKSPFQSNLQK